MIELEHLNIENSGTAGTVRSLTRKGLATVPQHHNTYRRWNMLDDEYLRQRYSAGDPIDLIADSLGRTRSAIRYRASVLGLHRKRCKPLRSPIAKFFKRIEFQEQGCWNWLGGKRAKGYGAFALSKHKMVISHRFAYEYFVGPIPDGMQIHHLCGNTSCCNPLHLTPVTPRENVMLSNGVTAQNARKTHCKRGHEFTPENIRWMKNGRACRECERLRMVSRELKRKGGGELTPNS